MLRSIDNRPIEAVRVACLNRDIESDPMYPACEARDDLPANRFHDVELIEDAQLGRDRRPTASAMAS